jgi:large conductance mechanosensitive channel
MWKELKAFILRGNVFDLAVGIIIGGAFGKIVGSLVNDIIMPPVGRLLSGINFTDLFLSLDGTKYASLDAAKKAGAATINYGTFLNIIIEFVIIAVVIFFLVKAVNKMTKPAPAPAAAPTTKECSFCKTQIPLAATRCPNCTSQL